VPVGKTLAAARRAQGKSLVDIQNATHIMGRTLSALEAERWDDLPSPVYVKGYIQNFATALGMDPAPLLAEYAADTAGVVPKSRIERIPGRTVVPNQREVHAVPKQVWIALVVLIALIGLVVWGISALLSSDEEPPPIPPETTTPTLEPTTTVPGVSAEQAGPATTTVETDVPEGSFTLTVAVASGQASWLQIEVDGLAAYEGTLPGGQSKTYTVSDEAIVRIGKPASVTVMRDDEVVEIPLGMGTAEVRVSAQE
jgi:cytoskeletal protein RodZ